MRLLTQLSCTGKHLTGGRMWAGSVLLLQWYHFYVDAFFCSCGNASCDQFICTCRLSSIDGKSLLKDRPTLEIGAGIGARA